MGTYLQNEDEQTLLHPFTENQLLNVLENISHNKMSYGNRDILLFDEAVSECLGTHVVYTKRLMDICRPHLLCISPAETLELQNNNIEKKMSLTVPTGLLTEDSTALFWLHPYFAAMLTKHSPKPLYTWSECCNLFTAQTISVTLMTLCLK